jgi:hypothetical protein
MLRRMAVVRTDVSEKRSASFIRVTRIGELGTTLAVTSNRDGQGSSPGQVMWDLLWTEGLWGRFSPGTSVFSASHSFH